MERNVTSAQAVQVIGNRFDLVLIAGARMRELCEGEKPLIKAQLSPMSTALKEIELGLVGPEILSKPVKPKPQRSKRRR